MSRAGSENRTTSLYQPRGPFLQWLEKRLPIGQLIYSEFVALSDLARALGALPAAVQVVFLALRDCLRRAWVARLQAAGGHLRHPRARLHHLLFRIFSDDPA